VRRPEGDVHEEGQDAFRPLHANLPRHIHQLVVLYPDHVIGLRGFQRSGGETLIDLEIELPVARCEVAARLKIVKEGPQDLVGETFVEVGLLLGREEDGKIAHRGAARGGGENFAHLGVVRFAVAGEAGAADPGPAVFRQNRSKGADQAATGRHGRQMAALVLLDRNREPIGHDEKPVSRRGVQGVLFALDHHPTVLSAERIHASRNASRSSGGWSQYAA
jgi:hypothetical protein